MVAESRNFNIVRPAALVLISMPGILIYPQYSLHNDFFSQLIVCRYHCTAFTTSNILDRIKAKTRYIPKATYLFAFIIRTKGMGRIFYYLNVFTFCYF